MHLRDVPRQIARHVEIVNGHVPHEAARGLDIRRRGRRGIATGDECQLQSADFSALQPLTQRPEGPIEPPVEADHHPRRAAGDLAPARPRTLQVQVDGLLTQHRLAGPDRGRDQRHVGIGGGRHQHATDLAGGQNFVHAAGDVHAQFRRRLLGGLGEHVEHHHESGARVPRQVPRVHSTNAATAEHCHANHLRISAIPLRAGGQEIRSRARW